MIKEIHALNENWVLLGFFESQVWNYSAVKNYRAEMYKYWVPYGFVKLDI